jgi:hypothetical protein
MQSLLFVVSELFESFLLGVITSSSEHPFNDVPKIMATTVKLKIDNTFFILQIYETYP